MTNQQALSAILGTFMPIVISFLKGSDWPRSWKIGLTLLVSAVVGFATSFVANQLVLSWDQALVDTAIVLGAASTVYAMILQGSGLEQRLRGE